MVIRKKGNDEMLIEGWDYFHDPIKEWEKQKLELQSVILDFLSRPHVIVRHWRISRPEMDASHLPENAEQSIAGYRSFAPGPHIYITIELEVR